MFVNQHIIDGFEDPLTVDLVLVCYLVRSVTNNENNGGPVALKDFHIYKGHNLVRDNCECSDPLHYALR